MTLHIGNNNIVDIRYGNQKIAKVYKGSDLVWGYVPGKVLFETSTPGTYSLYVKCRCKLDIKIVGAGGGGGHGFMVAGQNYYWWSSGGGGSGAYVHGIKEVTAGTYTLVVGRGGAGEYKNPGGGVGSAGGSSSAFGQTAGGGKGGRGNGWVAETDLGGAGGTASTTLSYTNGKKGAGAYNSSSGCAGGASVYGGYGAGAAANSSAPRGGNGYIKIVAV